MEWTYGLKGKTGVFRLTFPAWKFNIPGGKKGLDFVQEQLGKMHEHRKIPFDSY